MKILWFVTYGPDESHMFESKPFDRLKDAKEFALNLPDKPTGGKRPFLIERYEYHKSNIYGDTVTNRVIKI